MSHPAFRSYTEPCRRRDFLRVGALVVAGALPAAAIARTLAAQPPAAARRPAAAVPITVYKDPNCGCCAKWVEHLKTAGFTPTVHDTADMQTVKSSMGVPSSLASCHTAKVGAYVVEGHVPADLIQKLLREAPATARGLAVPGMPMGSPGMEGPTKDAYDILLFDKGGKSRVYASR